jgi:hypothetical protein
MVAQEFSLGGEGAREKFDGKGTGDLLRWGSALSWRGGPDERQLRDRGGAAPNARRGGSGAVSGGQ